MQILSRPDDGPSRVEGLFVGPDGFNGWDDGVDVRRESVDRPGQHGEFDLPVFNGSRVISVDGHALAWSEYELGQLRNRVMGVGADGGRQVISVEHQGDTLHATVRRGSKPTFVDSGIRHGMHRARFALFLVAADPRKYGDVHEFPAGQVAINRGNFPATPRLMVGAGSGGYTVTGPNGRQVVVGTAPAGAHYIDFVSGGLFTAAGVRQVGAITVYQPWTIPPGVPGVTATISGSRTLTQRVTDTYI
ncbi:hypothetical protein [Microbacterium aerolatum]|uniref:hypothetical protein n=1 Tax=Microbacterium aerolatum TaxID=153731 RepID=UPI0038512BB7